MGQPAGKRASGLSRSQSDIQYASLKSWPDDGREVGGIGRGGDVPTG